PFTRSFVIGKKCGFRHGFGGSFRRASLASSLPGQFGPGLAGRSDSERLEEFACDGPSDAVPGRRSLRLTPGSPDAGPHREIPYIHATTHSHLKQLVVAPPFEMARLTFNRSPSAPPGTPPAGYQRGPRASSASCPLSAFRAACVCARCLRRSTWPGRFFGRPERFRGR